ncbi:hypothetical protein LTR08_002743 [Meristemomyces frigidus]|nr:hypothetical protein LTR08_002743 [Meristemomyces frigidus]
MSGTQRRVVSDGRPALHLSKSFSRMPDSPSATSPRKRASTVQDAGISAIPEATHIGPSPDKKTDVFEQDEDDDTAGQAGTATPHPELRLPTTFDELPIEIKSLTERFLESLSAKVHPTPLTADALSDTFQDFYERAASHIATHIATLASRIGREKSAGPRNAVQKKGRARAGSGANRSDSPASGGEMLTVSEVAERKRARRVLELKRLALEEAVERVVCERLYDRIFKHKSSDDDERDEKLRSKTAALAVVGIGLKELHMDSDPNKADVRRTAAEKEEEIHASLADAREALQRMDDEHYPAGKLKHLTAAHKSIVETLSQLFPSSSSADEILPTLIYTLITSPPEGINVVSNLGFIQRFRTSSKVDGEAAYCLVNLEAAISFLETVDLSSLRADELPGGPVKNNSRPSTPNALDISSPPTMPTPARTLKPGVSPVTATSAELSSSPSEAARTLPSPRTPTMMSNRPPMDQRRLSSMVSAQADRIEAGRENFLNVADKMYDSINGTLENSFQFVFGRFKEQVAAGESPGLPKTLEDARKLVSSSTAEEQEEALTASGQSSPALDDPLSSTANGKGDSKMLELIGGRGSGSSGGGLALRDRSADSARSGGSGKRVAFSEAVGGRVKEEPLATQGANLFNAINPLNRFAVPGFARFGRSGSVNTAVNGSGSVAGAGVGGVHEGKGEKGAGKLSDIVESPTVMEQFPALEKKLGTKDAGGGVVATASEGAEEDLNARETLAELRRCKPPRKRFLEVRTAGELRIAEVEELLVEYRRLARAIGEAVAC